jgi:hypothetical protein
MWECVCVNKFLHFALKRYFISKNVRFPDVRYIRGQFQKFVDSLYYSESEFCGGVITISFSKYFP